MFADVTTTNANRKKLVRDGFRDLAVRAFV